MRPAATTWLAMCALALAAGAAGAQTAPRLVEDVGVAQQDGSVTVTLLFGCTTRYVSHFPATSGDSVRIRLIPGSDCGPPDNSWSMPPAIEDRSVVRGLSVDQTLARNVDLSIRWTKIEQFVIVPSFDGRGLVIRLERPKPDRSKVVVREVTAGTAYAINLDAATAPYDAQAIAAAQQSTGVRTYVSETTVDGEKWYRLRAGPFISEDDARRALDAARVRYPKAWLAVADDAALTAPGTPDAVASVPSTAPRGNATLTSQDIERTMKQAQDAFRRKDYASAIPLLTQLTDQPEFPQRAQALELLGLARERSGQLAHAKADYETYLRQYPQGEAADRVRKRLRALTFEASPASAQARAARDAEAKWRVYGGVSQIYRRDQASFDNGVSSSSATTQNAVLNDVALTARRSGERYDVVTRVSGGYGVDLLSNGPGSQGRVTVMFAELHDRDLDWTVRGGRQSGSLGGLIGTFDGLYAGYRVAPLVRLNVDAGYPVNSTRLQPVTNRRFYALSADFGTFAKAWDVSLYAISQQYDGLTDRQAVGTELRYFRPGLTFVGVVDYDIHYGQLNDVMLLGTAALPAQWTLSMNVDHRKSPSLSAANAMIGQPVTRFDQLFSLYTPAQIEQLALDRTAESDSYTLSLARQFGNRWQWSMDLSSVTMSGTPASGGVDATAPMGTDLIVSMQTMGYGLMIDGDVSTLGLQYQSSLITDTLSLGLATQLPVGGVWLVSPRFRVDQRRYLTDGSVQWLYSPSLRTEMRWQHLSLEFDGGAELGQRSLPSATEDTTRYYLSLGYRYDF